MSYIDDFIHRLNMIPPHVYTLLKEIRQLDQEVQSFNLQLHSKRDGFLTYLDRWNQKKNGRIRFELEEDYRQIIRIQNQLEVKSKEKVNLAERLYNIIHQPTEKLQNQLHQVGVDKNLDEESGVKKKRGKKPARKGLKRSEWQYDANEPKYCYCGRPSFGEMVMCENIYCDKQWFHVDCLDEKRLPEKWYCRLCRVEQNMAMNKKLRNK